MTTPAGLPSRLVVAGTDTDVGKTMVSALLVRGLGASYWKPVQCGDLAVGGDSGRVGQLAGLSAAEAAERILPEAYRLAAPASPNQAAAAEGLVVLEEQLQLPAVSGPLVVECAGGLLVPLRDDLLQITMIERWQLPVVLVARSGLGTLNHTLLSLEALDRRGIPLLGLVLNGKPHGANRSSLERIGRVPVLLELPPLGDPGPAALDAAWTRFRVPGCSA
jgi:dethiobiotin synthetase